MAPKVRYPLRRTPWLVAALVSAVSVGGGCTCGGTPVSALTFVLKATPASVSFGDAPVGVTTNRTVTLTAAGTGGITLEGFALTGAGAGAFVAPSLPATPDLRPASSVKVTVGFDPKAVGASSAKLVVHSTAKAGDLVVPLSGNGQAAHIALCHPPPAGSSTPDCAAKGSCLAVDFGQVPPSTLGKATVLVRNVGQAKLTISKVTLESGTAAAGFSTGTDLTGKVLVVGGGVDLPLTFQAPATGTGQVTGKIDVASNDPDQPTACIDLSATVAPNQPPTACAAAVQIVHADGSTATPADPSAPVAGPGDEVTFTAHPTPTCSADPEGGALAYAWALTAEPALSGATMVNATFGPAPGSGDPSPYVKIDAVGTYTVGLVVTDPLGATSQPATVTVTGIPEDDLTIQLAWHVDADLDLHLIAPNAPRFCKTLDCYWDTCKPTSPGVPVLDWGPDTDKDGYLDPDGLHADDPILVFDNLGNSIQPGTKDVRLETIRLGQAPTVPGASYTIGVNYFADRGVQPSSFEATIEVDDRGKTISTQTVTFQKSAVDGWYQAAVDPGAQTVSAFTAGTPTPSPYPGPVVPCPP